MDAGEGHLEPHRRERRCRHLNAAAGGDRHHREHTGLDDFGAPPELAQDRLFGGERDEPAAGIAAPTPRQVSDTVVAIRRRKLPDPAEIGNAGSFFKNPVVPGAQCRDLLERFPQLVHHAQPDGTEKLAAGWLIDQCGWKGKNMGAAGVYPKQALVLVNNGGATGAEVMALARAIQQDVLDRFGVELEPEPVFI